MEYLVERPLRWISEFGSPEDKAEIESLTPIDELVANVKALNKEHGAYGIIHGDLHPGNIHFTETDHITLFDFDHCAYGWRAYDLYNHYQKSFGAVQQDIAWCWSINRLTTWVHSLNSIPINFWRVIDEI